MRVLCVFLQRRSVTTDTKGMEDKFEWHADEDGTGILELHEDMTRPGPGLELQVFRRRGDGRMVAFWMTDDGGCLRRATVGEC